ncbi:hypothetical protein [Gordonibacter sp. 28C]|uniref:hypothetical protein n=1 Tax=Gordonibacter sp. 28C TaxID=2078569 RepID=UPI00131476C7|nr:hypothetical protein [Gordonibacter sp. 28C]
MKHHIPHPPTVEQTAQGQPSDETITALLNMYRKYRYAVFALGTCCIALLGASMALYKGGVIDGEVQFMMIMGSYIFVAVVLFITFARVRPIKADIRAWNDALKREQNPSKSTKGGKKGKRTPEPPASLTKSSKHPPTPEYKRTRLLWQVLIVIAVVIMFSAMALIRMNPSDTTTPILVLTSSYIFLFGAVYLELKKLKPMRVAWQKQQDKKKGASGSKKAGDR